mgnify:CR=1 FL=1
MRRTLLASAAALMAAGLATGAAAQTLVMWGPEQITEPLIAELWNGLKAEFEAANPGVTVEFMPPTGTISNGAVQAAMEALRRIRLLAEGWKVEEFVAWLWEGSPASRVTARATVSVPSVAVARFVTKASVIRSTA